jgi:hypothetical protein
MSELFEPDIDVPVRLPWDTICKLAVKAMCLGVSMNDVCNMAIEQANKQAA